MKEAATDQCKLKDELLRLEVQNQIKAASSDERPLAVHVRWGMLLSGCAS